ncbi:MAG TPA: ABC transporter ATP-binding protein [Candidatus Dormibacteraeota bacterium]|jgi:putative ABC transport system ATP-binding protein|nr:ABC transporter ATP-binding protein [Candidatus Dormibacteraeota bacterium]
MSNHAVATDELHDDPTRAGAVVVLRRGLRESPELRAGLVWTLLFATLGAAGQLLVPILIQQIIDRGLSPHESIGGGRTFDTGFVYPACAAAALATVVVFLANRATLYRLVSASERAVYGLRLRVFSHIHSLSLADQNAERRGTYVARVTADIDSLSQFMEWGAIAWITTTVLMGATLLVMAFYSWALTLVALLMVAPLYLVLRRLQRGLLAAYDRVRTRVGEMMAEVSESLMGVAVVRAYGIEERIDRRLKAAISNRYTAQVFANRYTASIFPVGDFFGALAVAAVVLVGALYGPRWGLSEGRVVAFLFLVSLFLQPLAEISETFDQTQTAIAGWRKVQALLDVRAELVEPDPGVALPEGPLTVRFVEVDHRYRGGPLVLQGLEVEVPAGAHVAVVGETGSGKTTFAKLLCRLADPAAGRILVGGVDLRDVAPASRREAIRMIPQDGFLFNATVRENIRYGQVSASPGSRLPGGPGASDADVDAAMRALGLDRWVATLAHGLDTEAGERGENLSVGERQLVALARAQLGSPGLLILDEATSAVDPDTERRLGDAMRRLSEGRTTITIAHRLSSAEAADTVLVFDAGRIVQRGTHAELVRAGGVYGRLYRSWLGNTGG